MSSEEQHIGEGPLPDLTSAVTPATEAPPAPQDGVVEGMSPLLQQPAVSDTDLQQQQQRHTSPTLSVIADRNSRRKQARLANDTAMSNDDVLDLADLQINEPSTSTVSPYLAPTNFDPLSNSNLVASVPDVWNLLRGKDYSNTFHMKGAECDIPEYADDVREKFIADFQSEVSTRFSGRQTNRYQERVNARTEEIFNTLLDSCGCEEEIKVSKGGMNDIRQCSRYRLEDILRCTTTKPLILCVKASLTTKNKSQLKAIKNAQAKMSRGAFGTKWMTKMNNEEYILLKCNLIRNDYHVRIKESTVTTLEFKNSYHNNFGFHVQFDGMSDGDDGKMHFAWRSLVQSPMDFLFFGAPLMENVDYNKIFRKKADANYAHHIFKQFAYECWGDGQASATLLNAYLSNRREEERKSRSNGEKDFKGLLETLNFRGKEVKEFFDSVNNVIKERVVKAVSTMQFYTEPLIGQEVISGWINKANKIFPMLMLILSALRGVTGGASKFIQSKWNQVLFQLFTLSRMASPKNLIWFSFIQSVANYGQGVPASAINNFFGNICSNRQRDRLLRQLTRDVMKKQIECLSSYKCLILVFDNYQRGQHLRFQREKHSSSFLKGTTQVALQGWEWIDDTWDELYKTKFETITYSNELVIPSAPYMPRLEEYNGRECELFSDVDMFERNEEIDPDFSGKRVDSLANFVIFALLLGHVNRVFAPEEISFVDGNFKQEKINEFRRTTKTDKARALFRAAKAFPTTIVKCWNEFWGRKTPSLFLGLVGIADERAMETGVLAGDLLVKSGIIIDEGDGNFKLAPDYKTKRHIMVGDAKSVENIKKFMRDVTGRDISVTQSSNMLQVFLDGLAQVMIIPGDWHAGMAMLQAIYTLWWPLLSVFKDHLGWKRVQQDVRGCYWTANRLLEFVADELMRVLLFEFVSEHINNIDEVEDGKEDEYICRVVKQFQAHLMDLAFGEDSESETDQWRKTWAIFIIMALDFKSFTEAYRNGDALMVEFAYKRFAPVWEMLGQKKYVSRHFDQAETLYLGKTFFFSRLMELRINRFVRRYNTDGNRFTAHDENLEIWNSFFARFPMVRTLAAFVRQGLFVGLSRLCSNFVRDFFRVVADDTNAAAVPKSAMEPKTKNERQLIFELLVKSKTHMNKPGRKVRSKIISDIEVTTDLRKDGKIGSKTKDTDAVQNSSTMNIHSAVQLGYGENALLRQVEDSEEEEDETNITEEVGTSDETEDSDNEHEINIEWDEAIAAAAEENEVSTNGLPLSLQDLWTKGNDKFIADDVGAVRATAASRNKTHINLQKELCTRAEEQRQETLSMTVGEERNRQASVGRRGTAAYLARRRNEKMQDDTTE